MRQKCLTKKGNNSVIPQKGGISVYVLGFACNGWVAVSKQGGLNYCQSRKLLKTQWMAQVFVMFRFIVPLARKGLMCLSVVRLANGGLVMVLISSQLNVT
ncbi:hypothetical protein C0J08_03440 [Marinomonas sp. CT5]|nr:hypothetical protein C0J08_03440 [Marinomonas sp. CT5]